MTRTRPSPTALSITITLALAILAASASAAMAGASHIPMNLIDFVNNNCSTGATGADTGNSATVQLTSGEALVVVQGRQLAPNTDFKIEVVQSDGEANRDCLEDIIAEAWVNTNAAGNFTAAVSGPREQIGVIARIETSDGQPIAATPLVTQ